MNQWDLSEYFDWRFRAGRISGTMNLHLHKVQLQLDISLFACP